MLSALRPRTGHIRPIALLAVLLITAAWAMPSGSSLAGNRIVDASSSGPRVAAAVSTPAAPRDDAFAGWAAARMQRSWTVIQEAASSSNGAAVATEAEQSAREAAAKTTSDPAKKSPKAETKSSGTTKSGTAKKSPTYRGTNHFWIPSLGMSYGVHWYGCSASYYPKNVIYRWGCAGTNNVYLFGHAYGVMKPLHDLYVRGGLKKGLVAVYANANGKVTKFRVTEWRVVRPTQVAWQIASQSRPSMTLQTCIGKNSEYRLNVRLVAFD